MVRPMKNNHYWRDKKILVIGASSDLCIEMLPDFVNDMECVGLHYNSNREPLIPYSEKQNVKLFQQKFAPQGQCEYIVADFVAWAGSIDFLVIMTGNCVHPVNWRTLSESDLHEDYYINVIAPFLIAQSAVKYMKEKGGRIIFTGTASAQNAGGSNSLSYGAAKLALECIMKRMAKDLAQDNILVNMVCPGFIQSKFHTAVMKRSKGELEKRAEFVPLKRSGTMKEIAAPYLFLLSENASFITGEVLNVKGGDWI